MDLTEFVLIVREPIFELGAKPGDEVLVRPGHADPVMVVRRMRPAYGELAAVLAEGRAEAVNLSRTEAVACLVRLASAVPPSGPPRRRWRARQG